MARKVCFLAATALGALSLTAANPAAAQSPSSPLALTWQEAVKPGADLTTDGVAQEFAYTAGPGGVTSVSTPSANLSATVRQVYGPSSETTRLDIFDGLRSVTFARANGDTFGDIGGGRAVYARASDWTRQAVLADPLMMGWRYQSFAAWQTGLGQATGSMGAVSFGRETGWTSAGIGVPQAGAALFTGLMGGIYNDASGQDRAVTAEVGLRVDFGAHTADFFTANTIDRNGALLDELNISGRFVGLPNYSQMFGTLQTARLLGNSTARFFGPAAEEFGGVFTLTPKDGQGLERLAGAFGATRGSAVIPKADSVLGLQAAGLRGWASSAGNGLPTRFDPAARPTNVTLYRTLDSRGSTSELKLTASAAGAAGALSMSFSTAAGDRIGASNDGTWISGASERGLTVGDSGGAGAKLIMAASERLGWDYQTFGVWLGESGADSLAQSHLGGASFGLATPDHAIPASGLATFNGQAAADYAPVDGAANLSTASVSLSVDFAARTADFASAAFRDTSTGLVYEGSALTGRMSLIAGRNLLSGTVHTADGSLTGTMGGRFYGPSAQEVGGTFSLTGPLDAAGQRSRGQMIGAFGAKR